MIGSFIPHVQWFEVDVYVMGSQRSNGNQDEPSFYNLEDVINSDMDTVLDSTDKEQRSTTPTPKFERKIAIVRHAETMNDAFPNWYSSCVSQDNYDAKNLNHPIKLPLRSKGLSAYNVDPPLTRLSRYASRIVGEALARETDIVWETVISAPELASVQTASAIASSTKDDKTHVMIDESLCDLNYRKEMDFITPTELMKLDVLATVAAPLKCKEGAGSLTRLLNAMDAVQKTHKGNLIIVVGASVFNVIVRQFLGGDHKAWKASDIPQLTCVIVERGLRSWKLYKKQVLPITNSGTVPLIFDPLKYLSK
ncbi:hypothetical protein KIN20_023489 [Parelaphostrongylus tenuis]|uniref:Phosphoglycerate mutase n=1 Tax=Parelaphostrongylus tenuis TaxID=148309 RepID=A0AAD5N6L3_PARTN|nr:hypothetical protein KIN20_023489 [Parelaphostrongylus tenuis]